MSHYHAEVWIPDTTDVNGAVTTAMAPYDENLEIEQIQEGDDTYWTNPEGWWDWWKIGGRWTGAHDNTGYDPEADPRNQEICFVCKGTGDRPGWVQYRIDDTTGEKVREFTDAWAKECNGCNSCKGTGVSLKWPTKWATYQGDIVAVQDLHDDLPAYTLVVNGKVFHSKEFDGFSVKQKLNELGITSGYLVTVDYHC